MNREKTLFKNTLILGLGKLPSQAISFILLPIYTIYLTPSDYGLFDLTLLYLTLLVPAITLQVETSAFRFLVDCRVEKDGTGRVVTNSLAVAIIAFIAALICLGFASLFFEISYASFFALLVGVTLVLNLLLQIARGTGENRVYSEASILNSLLLLMGALLLVVFNDMGLMGAFINLCSANAVSIVFLFLKLKLQSFIRPTYLSPKFCRELVKYSLPLVPNGLSWWFVNSSGRVIISIFLGAAATGIFAVAARFSLILSVAFSVFTMSWTESAALHLHDDDRDNYFTRIFNRAILAFGSAGLLLCMLMPVIFQFFVGHDFQQALLHVPPLIFGAFFNLWVSLYGAIYIAKRLTVKVMNTSILASVISVALSLALIKPLGLWAIAVATPVSYATMTILRHLDSKTYVCIKYNRLAFVKLAFASVLVVFGFYVGSTVFKFVCFICATAFLFLLNWDSLVLIGRAIKLRRF